MICFAVWLFDYGGFDVSCVWLCGWFVLAFWFWVCVIVAIDLCFCVSGWVVYFDEVCVAFAEVGMGVVVEFRCDVC